MPPGEDTQDFCLVAEPALIRGESNQFPLERFRRYCRNRTRTRFGRAVAFGASPHAAHPGLCWDHHEKNGAPGEIRTPDLWFRRPTLYPAELQARVSSLFRFIRLYNSNFRVWRFRCTLGAHKVFESFHCPFFGLWNHLQIMIHCHSDIGVPHDRLSVLRVNAQLVQVRRQRDDRSVSKAG